MGETYIRTREDMIKEFRGKERGNGKKGTTGHFQLRLCVAAFLFLLFFAAQEFSFSYKGFTNEQIVSHITENEDLSLWQGKVVSVFQKLK